MIENKRQTKNINFHIFYKQLFLHVVYMYGFFKLPAIFTKFTIMDAFFFFKKMWKYILT